MARKRLRASRSILSCLSSRLPSSEGGHFRTGVRPRQEELLEKLPGCTLGVLVVVVVVVVVVNRGSGATKCVNLR